MRARVIACALAAICVVGLVACGKKSPSSDASPPAASLTAGEQVYLKNCAQCHMPDGSGVPNMQPELIGSAIIAGDPAKLEAVIRSGSFALKERKSDFQNEMPPFAMLSDAEVKAVMAYVRAKFGKAP